MHDVLPFIVIGLVSGSLYGLIGTGLVLTYTTSGLFNFGHGAIAALSATMFFWLYGRHGVPWPVAGAVSVLGLGLVLGLLLERFGRALNQASAAMKMVGTISLILVVQGGTGLLFPRGGRVKQFLPTSTFRLAGINVGWEQTVVIVVGVVLVAVLYAFFRFTRTGTAMRAVVDNPGLLAAQGTDPQGIRRYAWMVGATFAGLSGVLLTPGIGLNAGLLTLLVVPGFGAASIGAFNSLPLTYAGGLLIGIGEALCTKWFPGTGLLAGLAPSLPYLVLVAVLVLLPARRLVVREETRLFVRRQWRAPARIQIGLAVTVPSYLVYDVVTPEETLEQAAAMLDWDGFRREQAAARAEGRHLGVGLSLCIEPSAVGMGAWATEQAIVRIDPSGMVEVLMGTGSHGHSLETTIPQVVAEHLGCALEDVVLRQGGDTPYGPGTGGSRSAVIAGGAAQSASTMLREKLLVVAGHLLEASPEDLEVADSKVSVKGTPAKGLTFAELAGTAYLNAAALPPGLEPGLEASSRFAPPSPFTWSNACHLCVCEVDVQTGVVTLLRYIVSEDCGVMINPMVVEGQIAGGVAQGIGGALYEEMAYDADGNPLATTFLDYLIPTAAEVPDIEYGHIETRSNSLGGYKGMGEGGAIASPAAVANAVNDALAGLGAAVMEFPITPARVLRAIQEAG